VSSGENENDTFIMPDLTGSTPQDARQTLRGLGWTGKLNDQPGQTTDPDEFGKIIDQEQGANTRVKKDDDIGVTVATQIGTGG
jgi:beta-lactam-binding protein with PASTA domain